MGSTKKTQAQAMETLNNQLRDIQQRMTKPNQLLEEIAVPAEIAPIILTGRGELAKIIPPRPLSVDECKAVFHAIGVLVETNRALVEHAEVVGHLADQWRSAVLGTERILDRIHDFAKFHPISSTEEEDADAA